MALSCLASLVPQSTTTQTIMAGTIVTALVYLLTKKRYRYPPGPRGWPIIGSIRELQDATLFERLEEWRETYGEVLTVKLGPMRAVFLNSLEMVQEAFINKSVDFAGRPQIYSIKKVTDGNKDIAFTNYGPVWQLHRKLALRALAFYMRGEKFDTTMDVILRRVLSDMRQEKGQFDIKPYIDNIIFNVLSKICFDECFCEDEDSQQFMFQVDRGIKDVGNGFLEDVFPPLRLWPTKKFQKLLKNIDVTLGFIHKRIKAHKDTFNPDIQRDLTDAMLMAQKSLAEEESPELLAAITDTHFTQTINDLFKGGIELSRQFLHWSVLYIAAHPEVQAKIHQELDDHFGSRVIPVLSDRVNLPYTEAVFLECMRISTPAPLGLPHKTLCDTTIGEYTLPKGTTVFANFYAVHHDPKLWEEPNKFKPERFLDSSGKLMAKPSGWTAFSMGKRACIAESLAKAELIMIMAAFYRNFEIRMPDGVTADLKPSNEGMSFVPKQYDIVIRDKLA